MSTATILVPCYNEADRLDVPQFTHFAADHPDIDFLFIDDGSTDQTAQVLDDLAAHPGCARLLLPKNGGKAEAVRQGMRAALARPQPADALGFWDADLATPLSDIPAFVALLDRRPQVEMVIGSRVRLLGRHIDRNPARHYLGRVTATLVSNMLGLPVYDTQCGAKLFRRTPHLAQLFAAPFSSRWAFDVEVIARWLGVHTGQDRDLLCERIVEFPLERWTDVPDTRIRLADLLVLPRDLLTIRRRYRDALKR